MVNDFPYPTFCEFIRFIGQTLDLKQTDAFVKNKALDRIYDPRDFRKMMDSHLYLPLEKYLGAKASILVKEWTILVLKEYRALVSEYPVELLERADIVEIMIRGSTLHNRIGFLASQVHKEFAGPELIDLFALGTRSVATTLHWIETKEANWVSFKKTLEKSDRDLLSSWLRGDDLPAAQSIVRIFSHANKSVEFFKDSEQIKTLLFLARAIDFLRDQEATSPLVAAIGLACTGVEATEAANSLYSYKRAASVEKFKDVVVEIDRLDTLLHPMTPKRNCDQLRKDIDGLRQLVIDKKIEQHFSYIVNWIDARWYISAGDLVAASELYKFAFRDSLFLSGYMQKEIINQSLVVFASLEKPDKVTLKHLKWSLINFGYEDVASLRTPEPSNKFCDNIDDWEIRCWRSDFNMMFPVHGFFEGVNPILTSREVGPLLMFESEYPVVDLRTPNRVIKVGDTWKLKLPQIVWFAKLGDVDSVKKLLKKRANVNVVSSSHDTPLLLALEELNITDVPFKSLSDELFWLICKQKHVVDTVNCKTLKKRLLPIISAVDSGREDIVEKVLSMGADVNMRGLSIGSTALFHCMELIGQFLSSKDIRTVIESMPTTSAVYNSMRMHSHGLVGFSADHIAQAFQQAMNDKSHRGILETLALESMQRLRTHTTVDELRKIALLLIGAGADPNAENMPFGHTPLMLAAELDEVELFDKMIEAGGEPDKYVVDPTSNQKFDCYMIAKHFNTKGVSRFLALNRGL